jgi:GDPmannose 4,6-dehydratase
MVKTALITGFTGQDGSYLAEHLLAKEYRVIGYVRPRPFSPAAAAFEQSLGASRHLMRQVELRCFPETSQAQWERLLRQERPDEIYHLAASSSVSQSWNCPLRVNQANIDLTTMLLEAVRLQSPGSRLFFACSSAVFGSPSHSPQDEGTPLQPCTPYGVSKAAGHWLVQSYRQRYGLFLCSGILFNHESPRRPETFVSRKIARGAVKIKLGLAESLELGDLSTCRDWGYAADFVDAMWRMLQLREPQDFVIGSGQAQPTSRLVELAFAQLGLDWRQYVTINPALFRPNDPRTVVANIQKAKAELCWAPQTTLKHLMEKMVRADMDALTHFRNNVAAA